MGVSRGAHCGASIVVQFAAQHCSSLCLQSEGDVFMPDFYARFLRRIFIDVQLSPHFHLRFPHFASKVSYSASPQRATMLCILPTKKGIPKPPPRWRFRDTLRRRLFKIQENQGWQRGASAPERGSYLG